MKYCCCCYYTEYAGHAKSLVNTFDLSSIDAIIMVAGDGLLYEVRLNKPVCKGDCTICMVQFSLYIIHIVVKTEVSVIELTPLLVMLVIAIR